MLGWGGGPGPPPHPKLTQKSVLNPSSIGAIKKKRLHYEIRIEKLSRMLYGNSWKLITSYFNIF